MDLSQQFISLVQIIIIDFVLAGDNAIVVGMAASRVPAEMRAKVIAIGVGGAVVLRIMFAVVATELLTIVGLTLAGGILLLWVCWKMYREITVHQPQAALAGGPSENKASPVQNMSFGAALVQIIVADVSMSLDNVLAVAGAARGDIWVLVIGLTIAIVFMALLSAYIAKMLSKYPWITWVGLLIVLYVALEMVWKGLHQVACQFVPENVCTAGAIETFANILKISTPL